MRKHTPFVAAAGAKENSLMSLVPWLEMGWNVVNVEYRLARVAPAPAAVEDALCALRFLAAQENTYHIDVTRLVVTWFGSLPNKDEIAKRVSPLTYVRADLPPILTIHGDKDPLVPYDEATRLHAALKKAGAPNELLTIPGGGHGGFTAEERVRIFTRIRAWLGERGLPAENP